MRATKQPSGRFDWLSEHEFMVNSMVAHFFMRERPNIYFGDSFFLPPKGGRKNGIIKIFFEMPRGGDECQFF